MVPNDCVHSLPNCVACSMFIQDGAGCGGCQRRAPTGGAAYGMPNHSLVPLTLSPQIGPVLIVTSVPEAQAVLGEAARAVRAPTPADATSTATATSAASAVPTLIHRAVGRETFISSDYLSLVSIAAPRCAASAIASSQAADSAATDAPRSPESLGSPPLLYVNRRTANSFLDVQLPGTTGRHNSRSLSGGALTTHGVICAMNGGPFKQEFRGPRARRLHWQCAHGHL